MLINNFTNLKNINKYNFKVKKSYPFEDRSLDAFDKISKIILSDKKLISFKDLFTFGFWCRRKNLEILKKKFFKNKKTFGIGLIFHVPASNIPVLPLYSLAFGVLTGNSNLIRIPKNNVKYLEIIISIINKEFKKIKLNKNNLFISYDREKKISEQISKLSDGRMIWGGDKTINEFKKFKTKKNCIDLLFGDKYSIALIHLENKDKKKISQITKNFYNDTFIVDQNACSSPSIIFWYKTKKNYISMFWNKLDKLVNTNYDLSYGIASKRYDYLNDLLIKNKNISLNYQKQNSFFRIKIHSNSNLKSFKGFAGIFFEKDLYSIGNIHKFLNKKMQTMSFYGLEKKKLLEIKKQVLKKKTIDRIVEMGRTLEIDFIWDGKNIFKSLTKFND